MNQARLAFPNYGFKEGPRAKPLAFVLCGSERLTEDLYKKIEQRFWPIDFKGRAFRFEPAAYYAREFGEQQFRHVLSFAALITPAWLPRLKQSAFELESCLARQSERLFNFDIGYMDTDKIVLASFKPARNKIYMGRNVYADMLLEYAKGSFTALPWAFPDFKDSRYCSDLIKIREKYKAALKGWRKSYED